MGLVDWVAKSMKMIGLTQGKFVIVDDVDFEEFSKYKWYFHKGYAVKNSTLYESRTRKKIYMHRIIIDAIVGDEVDHINGDTLDNQRKNLRRCTPNQNRCNRKKNSNNTSGYKGVSWNKRCKKWAVTISVNNKNRYGGYFNSKEEAAMAYNIVSEKYHMGFGRKNEVTSLVARK